MFSSDWDPSRFNLIHLVFSDFKGIKASLKSKKSLLVRWVGRKIICKTNVN